MKYSEAKNQIEALSSKYNAYKNKDMDFFKVYYKNEEAASVRTNERYTVDVWFEKCFSKLPFSNKLYMILSELAMTPLDEREEENKYCIHVFKGQNGYLNIVNGKAKLDDKVEANKFKTEFTIKEIEQLKQRNDIPLDWDKVKLEPVNN